MTTETTPSKIPISINNKRSSISHSLSSSSLAHHNSSGSIPPSRSHSPLSGAFPSSATSNGGRGSPTASGSGGQRRRSLLGGHGPGSRKTSFSEASGGVSMSLSGSGQGDDPAQIKAHIASLQAALQAAHLRLDQVQSGNTSSLPLTPINGLVDLPEVEVEGVLSDRLTETDGSNGPGSPLDAELSNGQSPGDGKPRVKGLPHSNPSYDLRSSAVTPMPNKRMSMANGKIPDGRSRIPQAVVAGATALHPTPPARSPARSSHISPPSPIASPGLERNLRSPFLAPESPQPPSPYSSLGLLGDGGRLSPGLSPSGHRRASGPAGSAASTRVIDGLQTELLNTRGHLERVKQEVRSCQRVIGSLTRQTEDLKETRERMRVECEGLNNVIARKERLLQEVLERARTAEAALSQHQSTRKNLEQSTKKSLQHMTAQLTEAQAGQAKAERECSSLRESVKSLRDVWAREVKSVKEEWKRGEEKGRREREEARQKHLALVKLVQSQSADRAAIQTLAETATKQSALATEAFENQISDLRTEIEKSGKECLDAQAQAEDLTNELTRLRRLMREPRRGSLEEAPTASDVQ
ncbi:hypothetical protein CI109_102079 [Kwoniella shandongensis]|uniref:Uncharacterized protein n=1 Tax=Kwoniella shandongensis TaxID=1734106 RepID=A0A5M6BQV4_9TREE|nr:uncharacterized protein CI109_006513 [Kwoniella shandongensis]KAA5525143.1 hypothetical protein CI109_006513 [Kwoniella shandongensis]